MRKRLLSGRWLAGVLATLALAGIGPTTAATDLEQRLEAINRALQVEAEAEGYPSLSIGIVHGGRLVHSASIGLADQEAGRPASADTLYRIGSVTKVFTASLMVVLRDRGVISLDDPVGAYLPAVIHLPSDSRGARHISFRHLATHTSGLPRHPANLPRHDDNPFEGYDRQRFYEGLLATPLAYPVGRFYNYSNLGYGLLGHALERAAAESYEALLCRYLLEPLEMADTLLEPGPQHAARVAVGYSMRDGSRRERDWDMGALSPAGGLYSTVEDLAKFLAMHMRAGQLAMLPVAPGSLTELQTPQRLLDSWDQAIGLGWHVRPIPTAEEVVWHSGALGGFSSYVGFSRFHDVGVIVLTNRFRSVEPYGEWLLRRAVELYGRPPVQVAGHRPGAGAAD
jgi:serine-type D-Ala-D-Ala carboxypeptidase/endopeptidase